MNSTAFDFMLRHHVSDRISAGLTIPTGFVLFDPGGSAAKQRASGFGDVEVLGRYVLRQGRGFGINLELESSLSLPTGESNLAAAQVDADAPPNILSIGRGAFAGSTRLAARKFLAREWIARAWVGGAAPFSANANNIRFGRQFNAGAGLTFLATESWVLGSQISATALTRSRSSINGELINSGGYWVHGDLIAGLRINDELNVALTARTPVYRDVGGTQITETLTVLAQLTMRFGGEDEEEHEHGDGDEHDHGDAHDHGEEHSDDHGEEHSGDHGEEHSDDHGADASEQAETENPDLGDANTEEATSESPSETPEEQGNTESRPDIAHAARNGASFNAKRIAVPGKITVVDFWAQWCGPCKPLTQGLEALARKHPDIALRKVEVPSFDEAVAKDHLSDAKGLPIVWIYDRDGKRVKRLVQKQLGEVTAYIEELRASSP